MSSTTLVISPRISEQTYQLSSKGTYVFNVPITANKLEVREAVQAQYEVGVTNVNIAIVKGKKKASNRKRTRAQYGNRKDVKKAYVTLKKGDKINVFEELE